LGYRMESPSGERCVTICGVMPKYFSRRSTNRGVRLGTTLEMMAAVGRAFATGQPVSRQDLAEQLQLRLEAVAELAARLEEARLIHQVRARGTEDVGLTLALPPEKIPLARLVELGHRLTVGAEELPGPGWRFLGTLRDAARAAVGERTLASLLAERGGA